MEKKNHSSIITPFFVLPCNTNSFTKPPQHVKSPLKRIRRRNRTVRIARVICDAQSDWKSRASSALHQEDSANHYVDLRSMKVVRSSDAHICPCGAPDNKFGLLNDPQLFYDPKIGQSLRDALFTEDTLPLSDAQKQVVQALLSRRSAIYAAATGEERIGIFMDIVMRNRVWKHCVVYCATSRRSAESVYAMLCAQLGMERRAEIFLDLGDGNRCVNDDSVRVIITDPSVLKKNLAISDTDGWVSNASVVFIDNLNMSALSEWEEVLLAMPSRVLMCIFMSELSMYERELLPLWLETIQNNFVLVEPSGASSLLDRIERPQNFPLLRTFAFNAAVHESPVQVSLTLLKEMLQKEKESVGYDFVPAYSECFLYGVTNIGAEDPATLKFRSAEEAEYADVSALVLADAKRTEEKARARSRKRGRATKRKERTASSRAAARRRRDAVYADSLLLPAIILTNGRKETEIAALAIQSALGDNVSLMWDDDSREHVEDIIKTFKNQHSNEIGEENGTVFDVLEEGIGVIHDGCIPALRVLVEELFRGGMIPLIVADTHLGSQELLALPSAKSVVIESTALALCDDNVKGFIKASTTVALAGRMEKDDVGNLIVVWYDDAIDDEAAGSEIASTLLQPLFSDTPSGAVDGLSSFSFTYEEKSPTYQEHNLELSYKERRARYTPLASSYDGILRSLRRFGVDGYETVLDYTIQTFRGWLERAALHATQEKLSLEKEGLDNHISAQDWSAIGEYERRTSKRNETTRVLKAMEQRYPAVLQQRIREELQALAPGKIIGVECSSESAQPWEQKLLEGTLEVDSENSTSDELTSTSSLEKKRESVSAAVFVGVVDQEREGYHIKSIDSRWLVVCILADGMWTMVPISDVVAISAAGEHKIANVDLLMTPHSATFDVDPTYKWAKCVPVDESEKAAVHRICDELISKVASTARPKLERYRIEEFEKQKERAERATRLCEESEWYGREEELAQLRKMRRRAAQAGDEIEALRRKEVRVEENLYSRNEAQRSHQGWIMAVLEDCHAVQVLGDGSMEMTPIGMLGSIIPGKYAVFSAACLSLIDDVQTLSVAEFAAYVAVVICSGRIWGTSAGGYQGQKGEDGEEWRDEELDMSILQEGGPDQREAESENGDERKLTVLEGLDQVLPAHIVSMIKDILQALQQLHMRHMNERGRGNGRVVSPIVPDMLNIRLAKAVRMFVSGAKWCDVAGVVRHENGYAVSEMRRVRGILSVIADENGEGEFSAQTRKLAQEGCKAMNRWPVGSDETMGTLVEEGVVEKVWSGNTYEKWWRSNRTRVEQLVESGEDVQKTQAEILES